MYEHDINNWFGPPRHLLDWGYLPALNRAQLYFAAGETEKGNKLLDQCENYLENVERDFPMLAGAHYVRASMHALQGDREQALSSFRDAIDKNWYKAWYAERDPNMASLHNDPEFQKVLAELKANLAQMRENVRQATALSPSSAELTKKDAS